MWRVARPTLLKRHGLASIFQLAVGATGPGLPWGQ
ncbi:hypothetical protein JOD67_006397 [Tenggerimyces flavus]|nr:hypothetical protein [Tenggerimyces flavus]